MSFEEKPSLKLDREQKEAELHEYLKNTEKNLIRVLGNAARMESEEREQNAKFDIETTASTANTAAKHTASEFDSALKGKFGKKVKETLKDHSKELEEF